MQCIAKTAAPAPPASAPAAAPASAVCVGANPLGTNNAAARTGSAMRPVLSARTCLAYAAGGRGPVVAAKGARLHRDAGIGGSQVGADRTENLRPRGYAAGSPRLGASVRNRWRSVLSDHRCIGARVTSVAWREQTAWLCNDTLGIFIEPRCDLWVLMLVAGDACFLSSGIFFIRSRGFRSTGQEVRQC